MTRTKTRANANMPNNFVSVLDYGADPTGNTDSSVAFQAALDEAGIIFIPAGSYLVQDLRVTKQGTVLQGDNGQTSVLVLPDGANTPVITFNASNWQAHNFKVEGNKANNTSGGGIVIENCYWNTLSNVDVRNASDTAWVLTNSNDNVFTNCQVHYGDGNGWYFDPMSKYNIMNCGGVEDVYGDYGIDVRGVGNQFNNCWIEWREGFATAQKVGFYINGRQNIIKGGVAKSGTTNQQILHGVLMGGSSDNSVCDNVFCADTITPIAYTGQNQGREFTGYQVPSAVDGNGNIIDSLTHIRQNNTFKTAISFEKGFETIGATISNIAANLTAVSTNGNSGLSVNIVGGASNLLRIYSNNNKVLEMNGVEVFPEYQMRLGRAANLWSAVYAATGTINTSDVTTKQSITPLSDPEQKAALELKGLIKRYKFNDAVNLKGVDEARWHFGIIAQDIKTVFEANGLNAEEYGLFCKDFDEETGKTYLGVRYGELLAFILAAL